MKTYTWKYCSQCKDFFVFCSRCGNKCCSGGYGPKTGTINDIDADWGSQGDHCPICTESYDIQEKFSFIWKQKLNPKLIKSISIEIDESDISEKVSKK